MRTQTAWAIALLIAGSTLGCDGDDSGGIGGFGGGSSETVCSVLCSSPCVRDLQGFPQGGLSECLDECEDTPVYAACSLVTVRFIQCINAAGCGEAAEEQCENEAINFGQCLTRPGAEF